MKMDCSKTENYFKEKSRMTKECGVNCAYCPLRTSAIDIDEDCIILEERYPEKAVAIVQRWSDEHPQKTWTDKLTDMLPNIMPETQRDLLAMFTPYQIFGNQAKHQKWEDIYKV